jgi:hypothetical protein
MEEESNGNAGGFGDEQPEVAYCLYQVLASDMRKHHREMVDRMRRERRGEGVENEEEEQATYLGDDEGGGVGGGEWETFVDEESGASYQYNHVTGESLWE